MSAESEAKRRHTDPIETGVQRRAAEENNEDDHGGVDYLFRYMRAWKVPKNTFSRDEEAPAPSQVSGVLYN